MERMFLKDLVDSNGDRIVHYTKCKDENKYVSVFNYSAKYGGTFDSFKYYNDYVIELGGKKQMKDKVFNKMKEYGWNFGDNTSKDFEDIYNTHYDFIQRLHNYFVETDELNVGRDLNDINEQKLQDMISFMSDFLRAFNEINNKKSKEDKIREYILSRNIQYDLVGEDLLEILNEEE